MTSGDHSNQEFWDLLGPITASERHEIELYMASGRAESDARSAFYAELWKSYERIRQLKLRE